MKLLAIRLSWQTTPAKSLVMPAPVTPGSRELFIQRKRQIAQKAGYELMLNKPDALLHEINSFLSLEDGDLIMTGTPKGVAPIRAGDTFSGKIFANERLLVEGSWVVK